MTQTLKDLKSGKLVGTKRLKLACGLKKFPDEIISLAATLEILDLSDNQFSELPNSIAKLTKLKIIFFANNNFSTFPEILASCPALSMIGFKSNNIHTVPENAFPPLLRWLILTDNKINKLPKSIGDCHLLQKCALAGNLIEELPNQMANCVNLELLRISANKLTTIPKWLFSLPKLSWAAFGTKTAKNKIKLNNDLQLFDWKDFTVQELLGEGASGLISKANWASKKKDIALKIYKGEVTSDGSPEYEMEIAIAAGSHDNLVQVLGKIKNHPEKKIGLIMKLIAPSYYNLGRPPSFETCTRDIFDEAVIFNGEQLLKIVKNIASVCEQLHRKGINHGDLYAHNIMVNKTADCLLGDFGAASFYDVNSMLAHNIERIEIRAFGCLVEDIFNLLNKKEMDKNLRDKWGEIITTCTVSEVKSRPSFYEILNQLSTF